MTEPDSKTPEAAYLDLLRDEHPFPPVAPAPSPVVRRNGHWMVRGLRAFGYVWLVLFVLVLVLSAIGHIRTTPSTWQGIKDVVDWFNPFNFASFFVNLLSISPALAAITWADRIEKRRIASAVQ